MILANLRARFVATDTDVVVELLGGRGGSAGNVTDRLEREGLDGLLDDPDLPSRLMARTSVPSPSAQLFIYVVVRHSLLSVGVRSPKLSDYLGALLLEFGYSHRAFRIARHDDETYRYLTDIVASLQSVTGRREFLLRAHLGNFALWLAGMFPEYIAARRHRKGGPPLEYFENLGSRGFVLASEHRLAREFDMADVYADAAEAFPALRVALNRVSDRWLFPQSHSSARVLRQVADQVRYGEPGVS